MLKFPLNSELYTCDHLQSLESMLLQGFGVLTVPDETTGKPVHLSGLENIIQTQLAGYENKEELRTYLVKDKQTHLLVCIFSLRTASLIFKGNKNFHDVIPSVELAYFAVNKCYREKFPEESKGCGSYCFDTFITDIVKEIYDLAGCNELFLFAINRLRLIEYYNKLGFEELSPEDENEITKNISIDKEKDCKFLHRKIATM